MAGKQSLKAAFKEATIIFVVVLVVALLFNQFRDKRLSLFRDGSEETIKTDLSEVSLHEANKEFQEGRLIFLDVRTLAKYQEGHIPKALNLPYDSFYEKLPAIRNKISPNTKIIIYGEGKAFSTDCAILLREAGFKNVKVFREGWPLWKESKLPVERKPLHENTLGN
jgi:rhodanese-related sulfurtransferase